MIRGAARVVPAILLIGLGGCHEPRSDGSVPTRLAPSPIPYFGDVPIPVGFARDNDRSLDVVSGTVRMVRHVYHGKAELLALRDFYGEQMPVGGWREMSRRFEEGLFSMRFEKEGESCEIKFFRQGGWSPGIEITIVVVPRNQSQPPPTMRRTS